MNKYDEKGMVICQECGKTFKQLTVQHLKLHQLTTPEYKIKYPDFPISSESFKAKQKFKNVDVFEKPLEVDNISLESQPVITKPLEDIKPKIKEEIKIEETNEFDLDKIPVVSKEFANEVSNFIEEVKSFTEENKIKFPDPRNIIHKDKLKILNFLLYYFQDLKNSYFIEKINKSGMLESRLVTDICIPSRKIDIEFPNAFWHNRDVPKHNRDTTLKESGWIIIDINESRPTITDVKNALKKFKLI
jgi:hypothetical protein